jgi:hypothetical protein
MAKVKIYEERDIEDEEILVREMNCFLRELRRDICDKVKTEDLTYGIDKKILDLDRYINDIDK